MNRSEWTARWAEQVPDQLAYRRTAGRNSYNLRRQLEAEYRRHRVAERLSECGTRRGVQSELAREFGVDRATITRDVAALRARSDRGTPDELAKRADQVYRRLKRIYRRECAKYGRPYLGAYEFLRHPKRRCGRTPVEPAQPLTEQRPVLPAVETAPCPTPVEPEPQRPRPRVGRGPTIFEVWADQEKNRRWNRTREVGYY